MKKIILFIVLFCISFLSKSQNNEIEKCITRFQYNKALDLCKSKYSNATESAILLQLGQLYNKINLPDSALIFLNKIEIAEQNYLYWSEKLISYSLLENTTEAKTMFDKLFSASFNTKKAPIILKAIEVFSLKKVNKFQYASDLLTRIQESESTNANYYLLNANYLLNTNKIGEAVTELERAVFYDSINPLPFYLLGKIYYQSRNYALSLESFNKSLSKDSLFYPSYKELGNIYYDLNKNQKSLEYFKIYCDNNVISQFDSLKLASMFLLNKQYAEAENINNKIFSANPKNIFSLRLNAYINYENDKNISDGLKSIETLFSIADSTQIITSDFEYRGKLYSKSKQDSIAIVNFNLALHKDSTHIANYELIAKSYESLKNNVKAAEYYQESINHKEKAMPSDYFFMGRNYYIAASKPVDSLLRANSEKFLIDSNLRIQYLIKADTAFGSVISLSSNSHLGYMWKARVQAMYDPETTQGLALPLYLKTLSIIDQKPEKYKKEIIESSKYVGYYYYLQFESFQKLNNKEKSDEMKNESIKYWNKIITIEPEDKTALEAVKKLNK
jgi:hypothetical protein